MEPRSHGERGVARSKVYFPSVNPCVLGDSVVKQQMGDYIRGLWKRNNSVLLAWQNRAVEREN